MRIYFYLIMFCSIIVSPEWSQAAEESAPELWARLAKHYLTDTGLKQSDQLRVEYAHSANLINGQGTIYDVALVRATPNGRNGRCEIKGPVRQYRVASDGTIARYLIQFPQTVYGVFAIEREPGAWRQSNAEPLADSMIASRLTQEQARKIARVLQSPYSPLVKPLYAKTKRQPGNDGSNLPWWDWSVAKLELTDSTEEPNSERAPSMAAVAILDENGSVLFGNFRPGEIDLRHFAPSTWPAPTSPFQKYISNIFSTKPLTTTLAMELGATAILLADNTRITPTIDSVSIGSVGLVNGPYANPHFQHQLILHTQEQYIFRLLFQHNLPNLAGRSIHFHSNSIFAPNYMEPVQLWFGGIRPEERLLGRPSVEGSLVIEELTTDPRDGLLTGIRAVVRFQSKSAVLSLSPTATPQTVEGTLLLNFPPGSFDQRMIQFSPQQEGIRVSRAGRNDNPQSKKKPCAANLLGEW